VQTSTTTSSAAPATGTIRHDVGKLPALGWNSWNAFRGGTLFTLLFHYRQELIQNIDINEAKVLAAANSFIDLGLKDLGYEYGNSIPTLL
jgi:alpha-galactosidase